MPRISVIVLVPFAGEIASALVCDDTMPLTASATAMRSAIEAVSALNLLT